MAHEISIVNGNIEAVFGYNEIPWWNSAELQATVFNGALTFDNVFSIAFPWECIEEQLQYADGSLSSQVGLRRSDTLAELGVHSSKYGTIQPKDLFNFCSAFFQEYPEVPISSAIAMRGGKVLNISARNGSFDVLNSGDIHQTYTCFVNSYDGSLKAQVYKSTIQPVCMNTTVMGLSNADFKMEYKHTKNVRKRIADDTTQAALLMRNQQATDAYLQTVLETLAKRKLTKESFTSILDKLFGESEATKTKNVKAQVAMLAHDGINATSFPDFRGTGYGLYNAITDYTDHFRPVRLTEGRGNDSAEKIRAETALIGKGADFKQEALEVILEMTNGISETVTTYSVPSEVKPASTSLLSDILAGMPDTVAVASANVDIDN